MNISVLLPIRKLAIPIVLVVVITLADGSLFLTTALAQVEEFRLFDGSPIENLLTGAESSQEKVKTNKKPKKASQGLGKKKTGRKAEKESPRQTPPPRSIENKEKELFQETNISTNKPIPSRDLTIETKPVETKANNTPNHDSKLNEPVKRPTVDAQESQQIKGSKDELKLPELLKTAGALEKKAQYSTALVKYKEAFQSKARQLSAQAQADALSGMARCYHRLRRDKEALKSLRKSIELHKQLKNARARSLDYLLTGQILMGHSRWNLAIESFEKSLQLLPGAEPANRLILLENLADCHLRLNQFKEALASYNQLLSLLNKEGRKKESARIYVEIGDALISRSEYRAAKTYFHKAETSYRKLNLRKELGETLYRMAYLNQLTGDVQTAKKAVQEGKTLLADQEGSDIHAIPLVVSGMEAYNEGDVVLAAKRLSIALNQYTSSGDRMMQARVLVALARIESGRSRLKAALDIAGKALTEFRKLKDSAGEAIAIQLIGDAYFKYGYCHKALEYAQESLAIAKKIQHTNQITESRILVAEIHASMGNIDFAWKLLKEAEESAPGVSESTKGRGRIAKARFLLTRDASKEVLDAVREARAIFFTLNDQRGIAECDLVTGQVYELRGVREKSNEYFNKSLQAFRRMQERIGEGRVLTGLGIHHKNLGEYDKALNYFEQARDLLKGVGNLRGYAANLANIGNLFKHKGNIPDALHNLEEALEIYRGLSDKKGEADTIANLSNVLIARGSQGEALKKFGHALELHRAILDGRGIVTDLAGIARLHLQRGELDEAERALGEARRANERIKNPRGKIAILAEDAMLRKARKQLKESLQYLKQALKLAIEICDSRAVSSVRLKMASVLQDARQYDKALSLVLKTLEMMRAQGDRKGEMWALAELGKIRAQTGDYKNARANLHKALELRSQLGLTPALSKEMDYCLGKIYQKSKQYEKALSHYHKALAMAQISGGDSTLGQIYHRIGAIYYQTEDFQKAKEFFLDALRVHSETHNIEMRKSELIRLGDILSKLNEPQEALKYQKKALAIARETQDRRSEARILTRIGTINQQYLRRQGEALACYEEAKEIRTGLGNYRGVNENLLQMALIKSDRGRFEEAVSHLKQALAISQRSNDPSMLWKGYFIMGRALEGKKRLGEAMESYRVAMRILESMETDIIEESEEDDFIFGGKKALYETTLKVLMQLARKDPEGAYDGQALQVVEKLKAASFENLLARIDVDKFSDLPNELLEKEKSLKYGLRELNRRIADELSKLRPNKENIRKLARDRKSKEKSFKELKALLKKEYPAYASLMYPDPVYVHKLRKRLLGRDEAILEYMVTRSRTYLFAIDRRGFRAYTVLYTQMDLQDDVDALIRPLHRDDTPLSSWDPSVAYRIYDRLIRPVEYLFKRNNNVTIIPHGPLIGLPFEMLVCSNEHKQKRFWSEKNPPTYLVEKYGFCYAPSVSVLTYLKTRKREKIPGWSLVAFGDAVYHDKKAQRKLNKDADKLLAAFNGQTNDSRSNVLKPLPGTRREISEIARIVGGPVQVYLGADATESLFRKADLSRYCYVHLATHGVMLGGVGKLWHQPAIVFSLYGDSENDGFLQLSEVFGLKLNSDIVVLSSCLSYPRNAAGAYAGLEALSRAFLFAGTDSVIMSMWQVNDRRTADLFIEMYRQLKNGSRTEALRHAKIAMIRNSGTSHPFYWAPFVLVGKWRVERELTYNKVDPDKMRFEGLSIWRRFLNF